MGKDSAEAPTVQAISWRKWLVSRRGKRLGTIKAALEHDAGKSCSFVVFDTARMLELSVIDLDPAALQSLCDALQSTVERVASEVFWYDESTAVVQEPPTPESVYNDIASVAAGLGSTAAEAVEKLEQGELRDDPSALALDQLLHELGKAFVRKLALAAERTEGVTDGQNLD